MKNKPGWLVVILISSVQLAFFLIAVMLLSSWFMNQTEETVGKQACNDNIALTQQIVRAIETSNVRDIRQAGTDLQNLQGILEQISIPNDGFSCVINARTGEALCHNGSDQSIFNNGFASVNLQPLATTSELKIPLLKSISSQQGLRHADGRIELDGQAHFVSGEYLPQLNSILLIGQPTKKSLAGISGLVTYAKRFAFALTLLLGLVGLCLIAVVLNRASNSVDDLNEGLEKQVSQREQELVKTQNAVIFGLAKLAESRDNDTGEHLDRIRSYVMILADDLAQTIPELDEEAVHNLALASSLHDIGKVGIPDSILLKPGRLSKEEREVMELHTLIGGECLEAIQSRLGNNVFMHTAKQVAYYHHERWDGKGYPHGLSENEIPLVARIVAVADVYDALTSKRPYKNPMSHFESKSIIIAGSGTQFDPEVVAAFTRHEDKFESVSRTQQGLTDEDVRSDFHVLCERAQNSKDSTPAS
jgi:HD-GYP domain-containing protein (c-di-GMP phosphodiesterase class II)